MHHLKTSFALILLIASVCSGNTVKCYKCSTYIGEPCAYVMVNTTVTNCYFPGFETHCFQVNYIDPADESVHVDRGCSNFPGIHYCELIAAMTDFNIIHCNECKGDNCNSTPFAL